MATTKKTTKKPSKKATKKSPPRPSPKTKPSTQLQDAIDGQIKLGKRLKAVEKKLGELAPLLEQVEELQGRLEDAELALVELRKHIEDEDEGILARLNDLETVVLEEDDEGEAAE